MTLEVLLERFKLFKLGRTHPTCKFKYFEVLARVIHMNMIFQMSLGTCGCAKTTPVMISEKTCDYFFNYLCIIQY